MMALKQVVPRTQSVSEAQGKAHLPYPRLQRWLMHIESLVQGAAAGPGTASVPGAAGGSGDAGSADAAGGATAGAGAFEAHPLNPRKTRRTLEASAAHGEGLQLRLPSRARMGQRSYALACAPFAVCGACALGCTRGEPPQWDAGPLANPAVSPLPVPPVQSTSATAQLPDAGYDAGSPVATSGDAVGKLPQTRDRPEPSGPAFDARARALFDGIAADDVDHAMPFFFPLSAYAQVKAIANPAADWKARLVAHYARDIHALHAKLGPHAAAARFVRSEVPMDRARWVDPGEEYNRIGYFRVYGSELVGELDGQPVAIDVTSLISWRGEWFIVHLTGTNKSLPRAEGPELLQDPPPFLRGDEAAANFFASGSSFPALSGAPWQTTSAWLSGSWSDGSIGVAFPPLTVASDSATMATSAFPDSANCKVCRTFSPYTILGAILSHSPRSSPAPPFRRLAVRGVVRVGDGEVDDLGALEVAERRRDEGAPVFVHITMRPRA